MGGRGLGRSFVATVAGVISGFEFTANRTGAANRGCELNLTELVEMNRAFALLAACGTTAAIFVAVSPAAAQDRASFTGPRVEATVGYDHTHSAVPAGGFYASAPFTGETPC